MMRSIRHFCKFIGCVIMGLLIFLALQDKVPISSIQQISNFKLSGAKVHSVKEILSPAKDAEMSRRLEIKSEACQRLNEDPELQKIFKKRNFRNGLGPSFITLEKYNLSACSVGKVGGTFLKQVFMISKKGEEFSSKLENLRRVDTHIKSRIITVSHKSEKWRRAKVINVARNPYTRLFSAYIDRVTLPSITHSIRYGSKCNYDDTFNEFLQIVLRNTERGQMDTHWSPIYFLCFPCNYTSTFIAKQESFTSDIKNVFDNLDLPFETRNSILKKLSSPRNNWTITGIAKAIFAIKNKSFLNKGCAGWYGILKHIWKAFQIQGYINENIDLPMTFYNKTDDFSDVEIFLKTVFSTIERYPLSSEEMLLQRNKALVKAYSEVDPQTIDRIKRLYRPDFEIFGYSDVPPTAA